jgi:hypothetical protein
MSFDPLSSIDTLGHISGFLSQKECYAARAISKDFHQSCKKKEDAKIKELHEALFRKQQDLKKKSTICFGWCVSKIHFHSRFLIYITHLFCFIFPCIKREVAARNQLMQEINQATQSLKDEQNKLKDFWKVADIFGGEAAYEKLPILDIDNKQGATEYIDFIKKEDMAHPIMRGLDVLGRRFFALRTESNCVVFFERYSDSSTWLGCPANVAYYLFGNSVLISFVGKVDEAAHSKLQSELEKFKRGEASVIV